MSQRTRAATTALLTGVLLWLGFSPRVASHLYSAALMPRCRPEKNDRDEMVRFINFKSGPHTLHGQLYTGSDSQKMVIFFGGRGSNRAKNGMRARALLQTGVSVFVFEYSGFGETPGRASINSLLKNGVSAYDAVTALGFAPHQIVLYGESLGAAVATHVSSQRKAAGLILQSGFSTLVTQLKDMVPFLRLYPKLMFPTVFLSNEDVLKNGHPPLLVMHGDKDRVIHRKHAKQLADAGGAQTELVMLSGAMHVDVFLREDWLEKVSGFLRRHLDSSI